MATHYSILAWKIPWTEEPGGLQSMGLQRVRHNLATEHSRLQVTQHKHKSSNRNKFYFRTMFTRYPHPLPSESHSVMSDSL